jgi:hypothetical protein
MEQCPGLNVTKGEWFVPQGKGITDLTVCTLCRKKYSDKEVFVPVSSTPVDCNCDGFLYGNKLDNGLFNISLWEDQSNYLDTTPEGTVYLNESTKFNLFIHARLADDQYFKYELLCNDKPLRPVSEVAYKKDVKDSYTFNYAGEDYFDIKNGILDVIQNTGIVFDTDKLTIRLYLFRRVSKPELSEYSNKFLGDYAMLNPNALTIASSQSKPTDYIIKTQKQFNSNIVLTTGKLVQCNAKPFDITLSFSTLEKNQDNMYVRTIIDKGRRLLETRLRDKEIEVSRLKKSIEALENKITDIKQKAISDLDLLSQIEDEIDS